MFDRESCTIRFDAQYVKAFAVARTEPSGFETSRYV
jgi:hypothetical protein